jgi:hypothetical protein
MSPYRFSAVFWCGWRFRTRLEDSAALDALSRVGDRPIVASAPALGAVIVKPSTP